MFEKLVDLGIICVGIVIVIVIGANLALSMYSRLSF